MKRTTDYKAYNILPAPDDINFAEAKKIAADILNYVGTRSAATVFMAGVFLAGTMIWSVHKNAIDDGSIKPEQIGAQISELFAGVMRLSNLFEDIALERIPNETPAATDKRHSQVRNSTPLAMHILNDLLVYTTKWPWADVAQAAAFLAVCAQISKETEDDKNFADLLHSNGKLMPELINKIAEHIEHNVRNMLNEAKIYNREIMH